MRKELSPLLTILTINLFCLYRIISHYLDVIYIGNRRCIGEYWQFPRTIRFMASRPTSRNINVDIY